MHDDLTRRELKKGEILYHEGDVGDCAYLIDSGSISIEVNGEVGKEIRAVHYAGDLLGEMSLIGQRVRSATATAREPSTVFIVRRQDIDKRLANTDPLIHEFIITVLGDLRSMLMSNWDVRKTSAEGLATAARELEEIHSLTRALEREEFLLYYQPIIRLSDMKIAGMEALVRWNRPEYGLISPAEFIPLAESSGAIVEIGRWILKKACVDVGGLKHQLGEFDNFRPFVSVNLSGRQLTDAELTTLVEEAIDCSGIQPRQLKLEVTESVLAQNIQVANTLLEKLKKIGVTVALDDFGTGQSSLEYLHRFPADTLKLDRSFVDSIHDDKTAMAIVKSMTELAKRVEMDIVAEGVESGEVADSLKKMGVDFAQGYFYARPMPLEELERYLERNAKGFQA